MHPLRDGEVFSMLTRRREADEESTGYSSALEGDEQEDGLKAKTGAGMRPAERLNGFEAMIIDSRASNIFVS
jgi:hypothetical protein